MILEKRQKQEYIEPNIAFEQQFLEEQTSLPTTFTRVLEQHPWLKKVLLGFAVRDGASFMHSVAVHYIGSQLLSDLYLRYPEKTQLFARAQLHTPFFLLHDVGKVAASVEPEKARKIVHPVDGYFNRPFEEVAYHSLHSEMSYTILTILAADSEFPHTKLVESWAELSRRHQPELYSFLTLPDLDGRFISNPQELSAEEKLILAIFRVSDITAAACLPRPNKVDRHDEDFITVFLTRLFPQLQLQSLLCVESSSELLEMMNYCIVSVKSSLRYLQQHFSTEDWISPKNIIAHNFVVDVQHNEEEVAFIEHILAIAWTNQSFWEEIIRELEVRKVIYSSSST